MRSQDLPYRTNVGIALFNRQGRVLIAHRLRNDGPEIILPGGAFSAVEKCRQIHELVPRIQKVEVEDLLPCHTFVDGIYGGMVAGQP